MEQQEATPHSIAPRVLPQVAEEDLLKEVAALEEAVEQRPQAPETRSTKVEMATRQQVPQAEVVVAQQAPAQTVQRQRLRRVQVQLLEVDQAQMEGHKEQVAPHRALGQVAVAVEAVVAQVAQPQQEAVVMLVRYALPTLREPSLLQCTSRFSPILKAQLRLV